ncbi:MAG: hypothetical protein ACLQK4_16310 [Acidimicrobiales bacterium]|jgi:hypothetical protein
MEKPAWPIVSRRQFLAGSVATGAIALIGTPRLPRRSAPVSANEKGATTHSSYGSARPAEFADDFDRELPGERLRKWEKLGGISVLGITSYGDRESAGDIGRGSLLRRHGMVVALDGAAHGNAIPGRIRTATEFTLLKGVPYVLEFDIAGAHPDRALGGLRSSVTASVPGVGARLRCSLPTGARFQRARLTFTPEETCTSRIEFASCDSAGRAGLLLDNVRLTAAA